MDIDTNWTGTQTDRDKRGKEQTDRDWDTDVQGHRGIVTGTQTDRDTD
jgi:hypothetical protein